ncbi:MAG TPA: hypothetical protein VFN10_15080 [Thermoanaerobaculia bacterium]|nr:hypothetical protein [Thermoanaerobaculia bacterium]
MTNVTRLFHPRNVAIPTPLPAGGTGHLLAMDGQELKKLAKRIVLFEYLRDKKDRYVFNPEGKPVPKIEQDDEALIAEAMKKCRKITNVAIPVYVNGDQQFAGDGDTRSPRVVNVTVDAMTKQCDAHDVPFEGRCADCALIVVGDFRTTAAQMMRDILSETIEVEVDVKVEPTAREVEAAAEAGEPAPQTRSVKRTVEQLLAEWQIERCVEYGRAKKAAEEKN